MSIAEKHRSELFDRPVRIRAGEKMLNADLTLPPRAKTLIVFAHGSGSGRHSPRNRKVAEILNRRNFATLLADLLTEEEEVIDVRTRHLRFDIPLLADRLTGIIGWAERDMDLKNLKIGLFGASTGAGAALIAAARYPENVIAVVSRGGRPDLAGNFLSDVKAPVLLIVGENDPEILDLNRQAQGKLGAKAKLEIIPRATHLFEEPGTLEKAAEIAAEWFQKYSPSEHQVVSA